MTSNVTVTQEDLDLMTPKERHVVTHRHGRFNLPIRCADDDIVPDIYFLRVSDEEVYEEDSEEWLRSLLERVRKQESTPNTKEES